MLKIELILLFNKKWDKRTRIGKGLCMLLILKKKESMLKWWSIKKQRNQEKSFKRIKYILIFLLKMPKILGNKLLIIDRKISRKIKNYSMIWKSIIRLIMVHLCRWPNKILLLRMIKMKQLGLSMMRIRHHNHNCHSLYQIWKVLKNQLMLQPQSWRKRELPSISGLKESLMFLLEWKKRRNNQKIQALIRN